MTLRIKADVAQGMSQNISSSGSTFGDLATMNLTGGNTNGVEEGNDLGLRTQNLFSKYQAIIQRDGQHVAVLAQNFEEFDESMAKGNRIEG